MLNRMLHRKARLAAFGVLAGLVAAEAAARLFVAPYAAPDLPPYLETREDLRFALKPGFHGAGANAVFTVHASGVRGPGPGAVLDTVFWGDSTLFPMGLADAQGVAGRLYGDSGRGVNAGVPGYNSRLGLRWMRSSGLLERRPRFVVLCFGWNDQWSSTFSERGFERLRRWAVRLRLAALALRWEDSLWTARRPAWSVQVPLPEFRDNLRAMADAARRAGAEPVFVVPAWEPRLAGRSPGTFGAGGRGDLRRVPVYLEAVREAAREANARFIDLPAELEKRRTADPSAFLFDFAHLNSRGQALLASLLRPVLRP